MALERLLSVDLPRHTSMQHDWPLRSALAERSTRVTPMTLVTTRKDRSALAERRMDLHSIRVNEKRKLSGDSQLAVSCL